jgi:hypothetical protein
MLPKIISKKGLVTWIMRLVAYIWIDRFTGNAQINGRDSELSKNMNKFIKSNITTHDSRLTTHDSRLTFFSDLCISYENRGKT